MRYIHAAGVVGTAMAAQFIAPVLLTGVSPAQADTGVSGYLHCVNEAGVPPRPSATDWLPTIQVIEHDLNSAESPAEAAQRLTAMGVKRNDAVAEVQCVLANQPVGSFAFGK